MTYALEAVFFFLTGVLVGGLLHYELLVWWDNRHE